MKNGSKKKRPKGDSNTNERIPKEGKGIRKRTWGKQKHDWRKETMHYALSNENEGNKKIKKVKIYFVLISEGKQVNSFFQMVKNYQNFAANILQRGEIMEREPVKK